MADKAPSSLVKYATAKATKSILSRGKLRWSSPQLFQDPYELDYHSGLNFDMANLQKAMLRTASSMIFAKNFSPGLPDHPLTKAIRRWRAEDRFHSEEEAEMSMRDLFKPAIMKQEQELKQVIKDWRNFIRRLRILCLCDKPDTPHNWHLFGDNHKGAALQFGVIPEGGGFIDEPLKVQYQTTRPQVSSLKEQVSSLIGQANVTPQDSFMEKVVIKSRDLTLEREWRCIKLLNENELDPDEEEDEWFNDYEFSAVELSRVYLGAQIRKKDKEEILTIVKERYKRTKVFQAHLAINEYGISLEPLLGE